MTPTPRSRGRFWAAAVLVAATSGGLALGAVRAQASDHDDGSVGRPPATNLSDLYVFKEKDQNDKISSDDQLIFIMNSCPGGLPGTTNAFDSNAQYDFHVSRVGDATKNDVPPTGKHDVIIRFQFANPKPSEIEQRITVSVLRDLQGTATTDTKDKTKEGADILTTPHTKAGTPVNNTVAIAGNELTVFAGPREDPFFFDVVRFFALRQGLAVGTIPLPKFADKGNDFTAGRNVNSIVLRVPRTMLQETSGATKSTTFDVWETVSVKK